MMLSLVVPLYRNEANLTDLFRELEKLSRAIAIPLEAVFVVDGSPDRCGDLLAQAAPDLPFASKVVDLSRNFGSFSAIAAGLRHGSGEYFGVLAADLQEPPELIIEFLKVLTSGSADIVIGERSNRADPYLTSLSSRMFWALYRASVGKDLPPGGVDIFACTRQVRDTLISLREVDSSLIALLFWVGFRRAFVPYERRARTAGKSAWTLRKRLRYAINSIFNFTDLPVRILLFTGSLAVILALGLGITVLLSRLLGKIAVPGYAALILTVVFFGGVTSLGLGIVGQYIWITLQNVRNRPLFIVRSIDCHGPKSSQSGMNHHDQVPVHMRSDSSE
jgi:glycosyltransferase involved in cell wall biosynthesis